jgi:hypothetical protein
MHHDMAIEGGRGGAGIQGDHQNHAVHLVELLSQLWTRLPTPTTQPSFRQFLRFRLIKKTRKNGEFCDLG